ncbi:MAG TPA: 3-oxoacyl-[acyl-carrier-protein] synthase III C-terminal domain-containing protein [Solirubrobacteraceae bacterium]|nr:3-oxoacyl-[acyl-carrier-protein] synthase III C-terminal domain-containing protein [Solirubrobacteraceae bacterium]
MKAIAAEPAPLAPRLARARRLREAPSAGPLDGLPRIAGLALAHPERSYTQEQVLERLGLAEDEFARRIFGRCGVRTRRLALDDDAFLAATVQARTPEIERMLLDEATRAVDALDVEPQEIGVVLTSSLYTLAGPTLAHRLVERYGMDPDTDKYHVVGVGCASAVPLLRLAGQTLAGRPGKKALVVAAESMSGILSPARDGDERSKVVGASIFGDGCAAALVEPEDGAADAVSDGSGVGSPAIVASKVHQVPDTLDAVRMQLSAADGYLHLIRELPDLAADGLGELVDGFLGDNRVARGDIDRWLLHPGGRRIIESLQEGLDLSREQARSSFDVLAEHGNVGTPAIFYVLSRSLAERPPEVGEHAMMVTVGPGVTVGLMLLRW